MSRRSEVPVRHDADEVYAPDAAYQREADDTFYLPVPVLPPPDVLTDPPPPGV